MQDLDQSGTSFQTEKGRKVGSTVHKFWTERAFDFMEQFFQIYSTGFAGLIM